eukprot:355150_1
MLNKFSCFKRFGVLIIGSLMCILTYFYVSQFETQIFDDSKDMELTITTTTDEISIKAHEDIILGDNATDIDLQLLWKCLFYHHIFYPKIHVQFHQHHIIKCVNYSHDLQYYLALTQIAISGASLQHKHYRYFLSLRRYILLITNAHTPLINHTLLQIIMDKLHTLHNETQEQLNHSLALKQKKYMLIHVMKSGGSSVCQTFHKLGFTTTNPGTQNCNIRRTQSSFKSWDFGTCPCKKYFIRSLNNELLAYERIMHGHTTSNIPNLCDQFVYILPFRHPIKRIYSALSQIAVKETRQPTDFIILREVLPANATEKQIKNCIKRYIVNINALGEIPIVCTMKVFDVIDDVTKQHRIYTPLYLASDFQGFFEKLYMNGEDKMTEIDMDLLYMDAAKARSCYREPGVYRLYWFGNETEFGFKVANNWTWIGQNIDKINFDFMKGYITNLYTRSFGYNHTGDVTYDALYAKDNEITM